jgi:hypothetical protein
MYSFQRSENVPGVKQSIRMGYPENTYPDICLCTDTSLHNYIALNSAMLRDALLNSKQLLESMGLKVVDVKAAQEMVEIIKAKPKPKAKEVIKEVKVIKEPIIEEPFITTETPEDKEADEEWS